MTERQLVSVVIPCFKQAHFLVEAIESVFAQSHQDLEIIVVDDGSPDNTFDIAAQFADVTVIRQPNRGLSEARNAGFRASAGRYVAFLDADDRLLPHALSSGVDCLLANPASAFVYGHVRIIDQSGLITDRPTQVGVHSDHYRELLRHNYIWTPGAVVYRRAALDAVGTFDRSLNPVADLDLNLRITRLFPVCCLEEVVLEYRRHAANMSDGYASMLRSYGVVLRRQYRHVTGNAEDMHALRTHWMSVQGDYGGKAIDDLIRAIRRRHWGTAARTFAILLGSYPRGVVRRACEKIRSVLKSRLRALQRKRE